MANSSERYDAPARTSSATSVVFPLRLRPGTTIALPAPADDAGVHEGALPRARREALPQLGLEHGERLAQVPRARAAPRTHVDAARTRGRVGRIHPHREELVDERRRGWAAIPGAGSSRAARGSRARWSERRAARRGPRRTCPRPRRRDRCARRPPRGRVRGIRLGRLSPTPFLPDRPQCSRRHPGTHAHESCRLALRVTPEAVYTVLSKLKRNLHWISSSVTLTPGLSHASCRV